MELRGFDSYEVSLGDELRGERACRGWTIRDASRELCIKPAMIEAIEDGKLDAFPNRSVVPGYVRSYARHLDLDPDAIYRRFCEESGFESSLSTYGMTQNPAPEGTARLAGSLSGAVAADFTASRFAVKPAPRRIGATISLGGVVSAVALVALIGGLGYGGYAVLQDIQRVGVAPLPDAPAVVADAPVIPDPETEFAAQTPVRPSASAYAENGVMFAFAPPEALATPAPARRDGPIAAIDPDTTGLIASSYEPAPEVETAAADAAMVAEALPGDVLGTGNGTAVPDTPFAMTAELASAVAGQALDAGPPTLAVVASDRAWVRVRGAERDVLFEGILDPGDRYDLPEGSGGATLRAGNAGGVFIDLGGARFGPLGRSGEVVKRIVLDADVVRASFPAAGVDQAQGTVPLGDALGSSVAGLSE